MVNTRLLASVITAEWNKRNLAFLSFCLILLFHSTAVAQEDFSKTDLSKNELLRFNELFFKAEKEKNLGNKEDARVLYMELYRLDSKNATVCYELALIHAEEGNAGDAIYFGERAVKLDGENKWFKMLLASIYRAFQEPEKEMETYLALVEDDPENPDMIYELAMAYLNNDQPEKAIEQLDKIDELIGINELTAEQKKLIYLDQGDLDGAVAAVTNLINAFPRNIDYRGILAQLYEVNGFREQAFEVYTEMLEIAPNDPRPHLDLAQYHKENDDLDKSFYHLKQAMNHPDLDIDKKITVLLSLFEASSRDSVLRKEAYLMLDNITRSNPEDPKGFAIYGDFLSRDGRDLEALQAYKTAVSLEGGNKFRIWEQILLIEVQREMYDSLAVDGPRAIELFPNQPLPYFFAGIALNMTDRREEGVEYLEEGLAYVIGNPRLKEQFYTQLADAYHQLEDHKNSDRYFDRALLINENNPTLLNNYAYYLSLRKEHLIKALEMTEKSNRLSPDNATFLDTWAWVLYQSGKYAKALEIMEKVIKLGGGNNGEVLEHYGDILFENGMKDEALEQWKKAKELGDTSPEIDQKISSVTG